MRNSSIIPRSCVQKGPLLHPSLHEEGEGKVLEAAPDPGKCEWSVIEGFGDRYG
jgi:hypothetical protein